MQYSLSLVKYGITQKYKADEPEILNYIHIYEIYINDLYKKIGKDIEIFEGEVIKEEGKEWLKLFTITIWSKYYNSPINYILPSNLCFKGKYIEKAIEKISNIQDIHKIRIETEIRNEIENEEINNRIIEEKYFEGYEKGELDGYDKGKNEGYQYGQAVGYQIGQDEGFKKGVDEGFKKGADEGFKKGADEGFKKGADEGFKKGAEVGYNQGQVDGFNNGKEYGEFNAQLKLLDFFFENFRNGKSVENIEIIGKLSYDKIRLRYALYNSQIQQQFFVLLNSKNLLIQ